MSDAARFEALYAENPDPWDFRTSAYERDKYADTLAALPPRIGRALEVGCSIGVLTRQLAAPCDALLAIDFAEAALVQARAECAGLDHVRFARMTVPADWPVGPWDLILLSEVLYFLPAEAVDQTAERTVATLAPAGLVLLVNWTGHTDTALDGNAAAERFIAAARLTPVMQRRRAASSGSYRLDLLASREPSP